MNVVLFTALATIGSFIYNLCSDWSAASRSPSPTPTDQAKQCPAGPVLVYGATVGYCSAWFKGL